MCIRARNDIQISFVRSIERCKLDLSVAPIVHWAHTLRRIPWKSKCRLLSTKYSTYVSVKMNFYSPRKRESSERKSRSVFNDRICCLESWRGTLISIRGPSRDISDRCSRSVTRGETKEEIAFGDVAGRMTSLYGGSTKTREDGGQKASCSST